MIIMKRFKKGNTILIDNSEFIIENYNNKGNIIVVHLKGMNDINEVSILKGKEMTLANGPSLLNLSYHRKIGNHYHTDYGMIELFTELITMEHDRYLKVKYILSDEHQQLSEVYVMMKYDFYGEENEAI